MLVIMSDCSVVDTLYVFAFISVNELDEFEWMDHDEFRWNKIIIIEQTQARLCVNLLLLWKDMGIKDVFFILFLVDEHIG